jgi:GntR family transcriptional regulator / MocR family aminotransferase
MDPIFELAINLPGRDSRQLLDHLHRQLRTAILDGRLKPGLRLPPTRSLADSLAVSRNTVVAAYDLLLSEGYLTGRPGCGTFVSALHQSRSGARANGVNYEDRLVPFWKKQAPPQPEEPKTPVAFDFRFGYPDIKQFPHHIWRRLSDRTLRQATRLGAVYSTPEGMKVLREAIVGHVSFSRAVACQAEDIVVTNGSQQAFALLARILVHPGRTLVAVEEPGYRPARAAFESLGAKIKPVPVDSEGLIVARLPRNTDIIYVTPTHQSPLGVTLSGARRAELLAYARTHGSIVIEDDYDSEFRYGARPLDALQTLDRSGSVFYVGTFTKSLLPSLRLGFVVAPPWAASALIAAKRITDGQCAALVQETLAAFISEGHLARYVRKMRNIYAARSAATLSALERHCAEYLEPIPSSAGIHISAFFRKPVRVQEIVTGAASVGIAIEDLDRFSTSAVSKSGLAFGFGNLDLREIDEGIGRLADVIRKA